MGIGIPGSGKTTALKAFAEKNSYEYICPDDIRQELTGNTSDQSKNREVWVEAYKRLGAKLEQGNTVIFDATFANQKERKQLIDFAHTHGAEKIQGVYLDIDIETAKERNSERERQVPEYVLDRMDDSLREASPQVEDGFDLVVSLDEEQKLINAETKKEGNTLHREFRNNR